MPITEECLRLKTLEHLCPFLQRQLQVADAQPDEDVGSPAIHRGRNLNDGSAQFQTLVDECRHKYVDGEVHNFHLF